MMMEGDKQKKDEEFAWWGFVTDTSLLVKRYVCHASEIFSIAVKNTKPMHDHTCLHTIPILSNQECYEIIR